MKGAFQRYVSITIYNKELGALPIYIVNIIRRSANADSDKK